MDIYYETSWLWYIYAGRIKSEMRIVKSKMNFKEMCTQKIRPLINAINYTHAYKAHENSKATKTKDCTKNSSSRRQKEI